MVCDSVEYDSAVGVLDRAMSHGADVHDSFTVVGTVYFWYVKTVEADMRIRKNRVMHRCPEAMYSLW